MAITYHAGRRIQGTQADFDGTPAVSGGWVELARTTLGSSGDNIDVTSLPDKRYYTILLNRITSGQSTAKLRINNDSGTNYALRRANNGGADSTYTSDNEWNQQHYNKSNNSFWIGHFANLASKEKLGIGNLIGGNSAGAGNAPNRSEVVYKYANTSDVISQVNFFNDGTGSYATGSECVVLGWDPDDTHTTNFWEELASVNGDGTSSTLSSGTFTAKKYLWIQAFVDAPTSVNMEINLGNGSVDTGANYSYRSSTNGGADATATSATKIALDSGAPTVPSFMNLFIINNASNEKLVIAHQVDGNTAGAGTAPDRRETVGKWANTSNQVNIIDFVNTSATNLTSSSIVKVWGAD